MKPWSSDSCATSLPSPRSGISGELPHDYTSRSHRSRNRFAGSRLSSASPCSIGQPGASSSRPPARYYSNEPGEIRRSRFRNRRRPPRSPRRVRPSRDRVHRLIDLRDAAVTRGRIAPRTAGGHARSPGRAAHARPGRATHRRHARPRTPAPPGPRARADDRGLRSEPLIAVLPDSHPLAALEAVPLERLKDEPFITYPSHFRSVLHDAVEDACAAHGFTPRAAHEVAETATLVSFVAAGLGVSLVPASVRHMTVHGAIYRPLAQDATLSSSPQRGDEMTTVPCSGKRSR